MSTAADRRLQTAGWCLLALLQSGLWAGAPEKTDTSLSIASAGKPVRDVTCRVLSVYDGDTLACDLNGNGRVDAPVEQIRLLGIDTPEMHYSKKHRRRYAEDARRQAEDEPGAAEASAFLTGLVSGKTIVLRYDRLESDAYGRSLAYVYLAPGDAASVCELMLEKGLAKTLFFEPNLSLKTRFEAAEARAREAKTGLWAGL